MKRKKASKIGKYEMKQTSTPLNINKVARALPSFRNLSSINFSRTDIKSPSLQSPNTCKSSSLVTTNSCTTIRAPSMKISKRRCDTPLNSQRSSQFSCGLRGSSQRLAMVRFSSSSNPFGFSECCGANVEEEREDIIEIPRCDTMKPISGSKSKEHEVDEIQLSLKTIGKIGNTKDVSMNKNDSKCISVLNYKDTLSKPSNDISKISSNEITYSFGSFSETFTFYTSSDEIENSRRRSSSSMAFDTMNTVLDLDFLSSECTADSLQERSDQSFQYSITPSDETIINISLQDGINKDLAKNTADLRDLPENNMSPGWDFHDNENHEIIPDETVCVEIDKKESNDDTSNNAASAVCDPLQPKLSNSFNKNSSKTAHSNDSIKVYLDKNDCSKLSESYQFRAIYERKRKQKKLGKTSVKNVSAKQAAETNAERGKEIVEKVSVFKNPLCESKCNVEYSVIDKRLPKDKEKETINLKTYPSTSTPFESPVIVGQNLPLMLEQISPVDKHNKTDNYSLDDLAITRIKVRKTYARTTKMQLKSKNETKKWESFLKKPSYPKKNKAYIDKCRALKDKTDIYLFETPPIYLKTNVPVDDLSKLKYKTIEEMESERSAKRHQSTDHEEKLNLKNCQQPNIHSEKRICGTEEMRNPIGDTLKKKCNAKSKQSKADLGKIKRNEEKAQKTHMKKLKYNADTEQQTKLDSRKRNYNSKTEKQTEVHPGKGKHNSGKVQQPSTNIKRLKCNAKSEQTKIHSGKPNCNSDKVLQSKIHSSKRKFNPQKISSEIHPKKLKCCVEKEQSKIHAAEQKCSAEKRHKSKEMQDIENNFDETTEWSLVIEKKKKRQKNQTKSLRRKIVS